MADSLSIFYNTALNITAVGSIITKCTALYFVIRHTPKKMRYFSHFIIDEMGWNLAGNLLYTVAHPIPMMPAECFRMDGLIGGKFPQDAGGRVVITCIMLTVVNCAIGIFLSFQFRYMSIAYGHRLAKIKPYWGYLYCVLVHLVLSVPCVYVIPNWSINVADYPDKPQIPRTERLFCFNPKGPEKIAALSFLFAVFLFAVISLIVFTTLCFRHLKLNVLFIEFETAKLQKSLLGGLVILSAIPVVMGGIPLMIAIFFVGMKDWSYSREIAVICIVIILNHGTIYGVTTLLLFKAYRYQIRIMLVKVANKFVYARNQQSLSKLLLCYRGGTVASSH
uniref:G protein-coupled receptor n=1 Tax=Steinernema glaseri TaxID=37863 RepID=A0A1I7Z2V6_9BILA